MGGGTIHANFTIPNRVFIGNIIKIGGNAAVYSGIMESADEVRFGDSAVISCIDEGIGGGLIIPIAFLGRTGTQGNIIFVR